MLLMHNESQACLETSTNGISDFLHKGHPERSACTAIYIYWITNNDSMAQSKRGAIPVRKKWSLFCIEPSRC